MDYQDIVVCGYKQGKKIFEVRKRIGENYLVLLLQGWISCISSFVLNTLPFLIFRKITSIM